MRGHDFMTAKRPIRCPNCDLSEQDGLRVEIEDDVTVIYCDACGYGYGDEDDDENVNYAEDEE